MLRCVAQAGGNAPSRASSPLPSPPSYEGRCSLPSNFDATYCNALGQTAGCLVAAGQTGLMATVSSERGWGLQAGGMRQRRRARAGGIGRSGTQEQHSCDAVFCLPAHQVCAPCLVVFCRQTWISPPNKWLQLVID